MASNRLRAAAIVLAGLALLHARVPDPARREIWLYLVALPIGYGHLLGGLLFARSRVSATRLEAAFLVVSVASLLCAYSTALHAVALRFWVLVPMLFVSGWHIVENDLALGSAYRNGLALAPVPRDARHHALALGVTALIGGVALATPTGAFYSLWAFGAALPVQWTSIADLATAVLMYHAVSWILFFRDRARALPEPAARALRRRLFWLHATPLALNAVLYAGFESAHLYVASPTLYLFWSVLHAFQTGAVRGIEPHRTWWTHTMR